ncbi:SRPBCC family protein [Fulvivirga ligni]|uniref:SRPBCC family protein n=1 Tax=Fulvivirga ligni TaxID=2904246 RepID=UPI001F29F763|nr:SRPBCC domain-containing protein [Fulvivirga ligni]UII20298.1 SRPBCC domain-containing protein [Fulvivirga ligni]
MITNLEFDFTVDKDSRTIFITREFAAGLPLVWAAFTEERLLDQWGAPSPWVAKTKHMNFEEGGSRLYAMVSPDGQEHWSIQEFTSISPTSNYKMLTNFADKDGNIISGIPSSENDLTFIGNGDITTVKISIKYATLEVLEMMIEKGFKEGYAMTMDNLDKVLKSLS